MTSLFTKFDVRRCDKLKAESPSSGTNAAFKGVCSIGAFSYTGPGCVFTSTKIGRYCSIAANVTIGPTQHPVTRFSTHLFTFGSLGPFNGSEEFERIRRRDAPFKGGTITTIGNDVWIGAGAVIMRGITVGDGAIIGTAAVVTKDVPPYTVVGGVPAKVIKRRFSADIVADLLDTRWWDFNLDHPAIKTVDLDNPRSFISVFYELTRIGALERLSPQTALFAREK